MIGWREEVEQGYNESKIRAGHGFVCGGGDTNHESGSGPKIVGCAIGIKVVHMRAVGEPNGEVPMAQERAGLLDPMLLRDH